jgi:hypothetical protein
MVASTLDARRQLNDSVCQEASLLLGNTQDGRAITVPLVSVGHRSLSLLVGDTAAHWSTDELAALARAQKPNGFCVSMPKHHGTLDARTMKQRDRLRAKLAQRQAMNISNSE